MSTRQYSWDKGFTLLEVFLSIVILASSLFVLLQAYTRGQRSVYLADDLSRAVMLARAKMTEMEMEEDLEDGVFSGDFSYLNEPRFTWEVTANDAMLPYIGAEAVVEELKEVWVRVFWPDGDRMRSVEVVTYLRKEVEGFTVE